MDSSDETTGCPDDIVEIVQTCNEVRRALIDKVEPVYRSVSIEI